MKKLCFVLIIVIGLSACVQGNPHIVTPTETIIGDGQGTIAGKHTPPLPIGTNTSTPVNSTPTPLSGIIGTVTIGPNCPGPVQVGATECLDKPYQARITILASDQSEILIILTDEQGFFQIPLKPGEYIIHPESGKPIPTASDQAVIVVNGQYTNVTIPYDSGIR